LLPVAHGETHDFLELANSKDVVGPRRYETVIAMEAMHMEIDSKIARVKELIAKREEIDTELGELLGGTIRERRTQKCSTCGEPGHRARTCPSKPAEQVQ